MRAIVRTQYGGPEQLVIRDIPTPVPQAGEVLIKVKAFGLNHAEIYMRKGIWGDVHRSVELNVLDRWNMIQPVA